MTLPRYWLSRAIIAALSLFMGLTALLDQRTLVHAVLAGGDPMGQAVLMLLCAVAALALVDVLVNDLLPPRIVFRLARRARPLVYMALSVGNLMVGAMLARHVGFGWLHAQVMMVVVVAVGLAISDPFIQHRGKP